MSDPVPSRVAVGELSAFAGRSGDFGTRHFSLLRGIEGIRTHQRVQKSRGPEYQSEQSVRALWQGELELFGRIDGVATEDGETVLEEIKTTREAADMLPLDHSVHCLQLLLYVWIWRERTGVCPRARLVYVSPDDPKIERRIHLNYSPESLDSDVHAACSLWINAVTALTLWREQRNRSLIDLAFPYSDLRPGQAELMHAAENILRQGGRLYAQAPTGIGKTLALLLPALRSMGEGRISKIYIATCRNSGKAVFAEAAKLLVEQGASLRALTLVAKDRSCRKTGIPCDCATCPLALGFYDRVQGALAELRTRPNWDAETWMAIAAGFEVCPHAFLLHAIREADLLIGDLNHAIDPSARLETWMTEEPERLVLLIDEAHHLPERSRDMLSASLDSRGLSPFSAPALRGLSPFLHKIRREFREYQRIALQEDGSPAEGQDAPVSLAEACRRGVEAIEGSFGVCPRFVDDPREDVLRKLRAFGLSVERRRPSQIFFREGQTLYSFCRDAADWLTERFLPLHAVMFCSATLHPLPIFRRLSGALPENREIDVPAPFDPAHFPIRLEKNIPMVWRARGVEMYDKLTARIRLFLEEQPGRALVFLPSFDMLEEVRKRLPAHDLWLGSVLAQPRGLQEESAEQFLRPFRSSSGPVTGLAVLGGALNEGIDLPGDTLNSVVVVSIALPAVTRPREYLRAWHQDQGEDGFVMAYTAPGLARVLQALGRVIRGPGDRGRALLIDPRFEHPFYRPFIHISP